MTHKEIRVCVSRDRFSIRCVSFVINCDTRCAAPVVRRCDTLERFACCIRESRGNTRLYVKSPAESACNDTDRTPIRAARRFAPRERDVRTRHTLGISFTRSNEPHKTRVFSPYLLVWRNCRAVLAASSSTFAENAANSRPHLAEFTEERHADWCNAVTSRRDPSDADVYR